MADTAAFCVDHLFRHVPARQYVLSVPYQLRFKMAYSPNATSMVLGAFISAINSDRRRAHPQETPFETIGHLPCPQITTGDLASHRLSHRLVFA